MVENFVSLYGSFDGLQHLNDLYALDLRENRLACLLPHDDSRADVPR